MGREECFNKLKGDKRSLSKLRKEFGAKLSSVELFKKESQVQVLREKFDTPVKEGKTIKCCWKKQSPKAETVGSMLIGFFFQVQYAKSKSKKWVPYHLLAKPGDESNDSSLNISTEAYEMDNFLEKLIERLSKKRC